MGWIRISGTTSSNSWPTHGSENRKKRRTQLLMRHLSQHQCSRTHATNTSTKLPVVDDKISDRLVQSICVRSSTSATQSIVKKERASAGRTSSRVIEVPISTPSTRKTTTTSSLASPHPMTRASKHHPRSSPRAKLQMSVRWRSRCEIQRYQQRRRDSRALHHGHRLLSRGAMDST